MLRVSEEHAGKKLRCPGCKEVLQVPARLPPSPAAPARNGLPGSIQTAVGFSIALACLHGLSLVVAFLTMKGPMNEFEMGRIGGSILMLVCCVIVAFGLIKRENWALIMGVVVFGLAFGLAALLFVLVLMSPGRDQFTGLLLMGFACVLNGIPFFTILVNRVRGARNAR